MIFRKFEDLIRFFWVFFDGLFGLDPFGSQFGSFQCCLNYVQSFFNDVYFIFLLILRRSWLDMFVEFLF